MSTVRPTRLLAPSPVVRPVVRLAARSRAVAAVLALCVGASAPAWVAAQSTGTGGTGTRTAAAPAPTTREGDWMLSVNPLGLLYGGVTGEVERRLGGTRTAAIAANYWGGYGGWSYLSMDAKLRFYRRTAGQKVAITNTDVADFEGLSFGPLVGFQRVSADFCAVLNENCSATGLTAGGTVDYGWRLGKEKAFSAVAGGGFKAGFGFGDLIGVRTAYPFIRLGVGYVLPKGK